MAIVTDNWLLDLLSFLIAASTLLISWMTWKQQYWDRKGVPIPPKTFFFGHIKPLVLQKESIIDFIERYYQYFKNRKEIHGGLHSFFMSMYLPIDLEIIKCILQKDFEHFVDRGMVYNEEADPLSAHLFSLEGSKWRNLRVKLTPTFTSGKIKMMFETLVKCGDQLKIEMDKSVEKLPIDIRDILGRFTIDIIGNCAFGIDCNSLQDPDNEFRRYLKTFFINSFWENIYAMVVFLFPEMAKKFGMTVVKPDLSKFFMKVVKDTVEYRETNHIYRKDFMHLLLQLKNRGKLVDDGKLFGDETGDVSLTMNELSAQAFVFFLAGFETSSTTMTFCLYELTSNPEIQEKLRQEIEEVLARHENKITYEAIMEMHYMEQVINETLRKYPPLPILNRKCTKDYKIPGTDIILEKETLVNIPVVAIHHDPEFYPEPEKFDPERFSEENRRQRHPMAFLPFGEGPRICIGLRFGMLQTKVGLCVLLKNYKFRLNPKTNFKIDPKSFITSVEGGIWLDYEKLN